MGKRKLAMHYAGDRRDEVRVGEVMGPGNDGFFREVTSVTYDGRRKRTLVEFKRVHVELDEGRRLVYYGGRDPDVEAPDSKAPAEPHREVPR